MFSAEVKDTARVRFARGFDRTTKSFGKLFIAATCPCCEAYKFQPASEDDAFTLRTRGSQIIDYKPVASKNQPVFRERFGRLYSRNENLSEEARKIEDERETMQMLDELRSNEVALRPKLDMERFNRGIVGIHKAQHNRRQSNNTPKDAVAVDPYLVAEIMKIIPGLELG